MKKFANIYLTNQPKHNLRLHKLSRIDLKSVKLPDLKVFWNSLHAFPQEHHFYMVQTNLADISPWLYQKLWQISLTFSLKTWICPGFFLLYPYFSRQVMTSCTKNTKLSSNSNGKGMSEVKYIIDVNTTLSKHKYVYNNMLCQYSVHKNCW